MDFANSFLNAIVQGGAKAIFGLMTGAIVFLVWERHRLLSDITEMTNKVIEAKDSEMKSIKEIITRYHQGSVDMIQALNEIKVVLTSIQISRR